MCLCSAKLMNLQKKSEGVISNQKISDCTGHTQPHWFFLSWKSQRVFGATRATRATGDHLVATKCTYTGVRVRMPTCGVAKIMSIKIRDTRDILIFLPHFAGQSGNSTRFTARKFFLSTICNSLGKELLKLVGNTEEGLTFASTWHFGHQPVS